MNSLTNSAIKTYRKCQRAYELRYERGLRPVSDAAALFFGSLWHRGLEVWWQTHDIEQTLIAVDVPDVSPLDLIKLRALLTGYHYRWVDVPIETILVEAEFETPLINPITGFSSKTWTMRGNLDALARTPDSRVWLVEHKTSSEDVSSGSQYWARLRLDSQISTYFMGARALGYEVSGCLYDVVRKPAIRPYQATPIESRKYTKDGRLYAAQRAEDETPEEYQVRLLEDIAGDPGKYFSRGEVVRLEEEEIDAAHDAWQFGRLIRESQLANRWPRNPDACVTYGRECEYWPICTKTASADDPTRYYVEEQVHSELSPRPAEVEETPATPIGGHAA